MGNCASCYPLDTLLSVSRVSADEEDESHPSDSARLLYSQLSSRRNVRSYGSTPSPAISYPETNSAVSTLRLNQALRTQGSSELRSKRSALSVVQPESTSETSDVSELHGSPLDEQKWDAEQRRKTLRIEAVLDHFRNQVIDVYQDPVIYPVDFEQTPTSPTVAPSSEFPLSYPEGLPAHPKNRPTAQSQSHSHSRSRAPTRSKRPKWYQDTLIPNLLDHEREESRNAYVRHRRKLDEQEEAALAVQNRREMRKKRSNEAQAGRRKQLDEMAIDRDELANVEQEQRVGENEKPDAAIETPACATIHEPRGPVRKTSIRRVTWTAEDARRMVAEPV